MYTKEEMLEIYKQGDFKRSEFTDLYQHVPNVTTPEFLIPLALIPMGDEEVALRANPIAQPPTGGGRGGGRGYQERDGRGRGRGRGQDRNRDGWMQRNSDGAESEGRWGRHDRHDRHSREPRDSANSDGGGGGSGGLPPPNPASPKGAPALGQGCLSPPQPAQPALPPPPVPKDWFYRDLEQTVQGPFTEAQISEWYGLKYLPTTLHMRSSEDPPDVYTQLSTLIEQSGGEPPFVVAFKKAQQYEAEVAARSKTPESPAEVRSDDVRQHDAAAKQQAQRADEDRARRMAQEQAQEQARLQAEQQMHRKMLDEAKESAMREAEELRRRALEDARQAAEADAQRHRQELQKRLQQEAEQMQRQQQEQAEHARRQAEELSRRQAALEEAQRRQAESEEMTRRQAEALARQQAALEEHQRQLSIGNLPPASNPSAGSALLSLLQSSGGGANSNALPSLPGWSGAAQGQPQQQPAAAQQQPAPSSQLEQLWTQAGQPAPQAAKLPAAGAVPAQAPSPSSGGAELSRGRGRGRGVCSAALGMRRGPGEADPAIVAVSGGGAMAGADGIARGIGGVQLQSGALDLPMGAPLEDPADSEAGRKGKKGKQRPAKGAKGGEQEGALGGLLGQDDPSWPGQPAAASPAPALVWGWSEQGGGGGGAQQRAQSLQEIQVAEEQERKRREAQASAEAMAALARQPQTAQGAWANARPASSAPLGAAQPAPSPVRPAAPQAPADPAADMLWDYAPAEPASPAQPSAPASNGSALASPAAKSSSSKKKKGKGVGTPEAPVAQATAQSNGRAEAGEDPDAFGLSGGAMPASMARWCEEQMAALTGNDDSTLAQFLYTLESDAEVESYLSMYLGARPRTAPMRPAHPRNGLQRAPHRLTPAPPAGSSTSVSNFAREFSLRKRAAHGKGESREWQTAGRSGKASTSTPTKDDDADGFDVAGKGRRNKGKKKVDPTLLGFSVESSRIMQGEIQFADGM